MVDMLFTPDADAEISQLFADIEQTRDGSPLVLAVEQYALSGDGANMAPHLLLDAMVAQYGYTGPGPYWIEVARRVARKILVHVLHEELAYPEETMDQTEAEAFAERFLNLFDSDSHYYTNGVCSGEASIFTLEGEQVLGWRSISALPFDNGLIVVSSQRIGMIWAEDEG